VRLISHGWIAETDELFRNYRDHITPSGCCVRKRLVFLIVCFGVQAWSCVPTESEVLVQAGVVVGLFACFGCRPRSVCFLRCFF
jgi:hypothetical protein